MTSTPLNILALDDDPLDTELLGHFLSDIPKWSVDFNGMTDPTSCVEYVDRSPPDLMFVDFHMGAVSGLDVLHKLEAANLRLPVIMLTGQGSEEVAVESLQAGAIDYLPKMRLTSDCLESAIDNALYKHKQRLQEIDDRTLLEETNHVLEKRNREIQTCYHSMSHELKTPLTVIREFLSLVLDEVAGEINDEQREFLDIAKQSCDGMVKSVNDLLDSARIDGGRCVLDLAPVCLETYLTMLARSFQPTATECQIALHTRLQSGVGAVLADEMRLRQVLGNLVSNALKFTPAGGDVTIHMRDDESHDGYALVSVEDTGRGIEADSLERIFDRFAQCREEDSKTHKGLGLGLCISRELVQLHGGQIWAESKVGVGTTFHLTLPKALAGPNRA